MGVCLLFGRITSKNAEGSREGLSSDWDDCDMVEIDGLINIGKGFTSNGVSNAISKCSMPKGLYQEVNMGGAYESVFVIDKEKFDNFESLIILIEEKGEIHQYRAGEITALGEISANNNDYGFYYS